MSQSGMQSGLNVNTAIFHIYAYYDLKKNFE